MREDEIDVAYEKEAYASQIPVGTVRSRLAAVLDALSIKENVELSVNFVSEEHMQKLNQHYREKNESTDILTFVQDDVTDIPWPTGEDGPFHVLGDMVICPDVMRRNAASFSVSEDEELYRLLIHGVLHLLGKDHRTNELTEPMIQEQEALLVRLGGKKEK